MAAACSGVRPWKCKCWWRETAGRPARLARSWACSSVIACRNVTGSAFTARGGSSGTTGQGGAASAGGLPVAAAGDHDIADQADHQQAAGDSQDDQQEGQHAGQDVGG